MPQLLANWKWHRMRQIYMSTIRIEVVCVRMKNMQRSMRPEFMVAVDTETQSDHAKLFRAGRVQSSDTTGIQRTVKSMCTANFVARIRFIGAAVTIATMASVAPATGQRAVSWRAARDTVNCCTTRGIGMGISFAGNGRDSPRSIASIDASATINTFSMCRSRNAFAPNGRRNTNQWPLVAIDKIRILTFALLFIHIQLRISTNKKWFAWTFRDIPTADKLILPWIIHIFADAFFLFFGMYLFPVFVHRWAESERFAAVIASICIRHSTVNVRVLLKENSSKLEHE